jgi:hypothetical protein
MELSNIAGAETKLSLRRTAMTILMIKDLPFADEMDRTEMTKVSGGLSQEISDYINFVALYTHGQCVNTPVGIACSSAF